MTSFPTPAELVLEYADMPPNAQTVFRTLVAEAGHVPGTNGRTRGQLIKITQMGAREVANGLDWLDRREHVVFTPDDATWSLAFWTPRNARALATRELLLNAEV